MSKICTDATKNLTQLLYNPVPINITPDALKGFDIIDKLKEILISLQEEKKLFMRKYEQSKEQYLLRISDQEKQLIRLSEQNAMLQSKYDQIKCSIDQKGSVITYLKQCITKNEVKNQSQMNHLKSINGYLEGRNQHLEGIISELRRRQSSFNFGYDQTQFLFDHSSSSSLTTNRMLGSPKIGPRPLTKLESDSHNNFSTNGRTNPQNQSCVIINNNSKNDQCVSYPSTLDINIGEHEAPDYRLYFKKNKNKQKQLKTSKLENTAKKVDKKPRKSTGDCHSGGGSSNLMKMSYMEVNRASQKSIKDLKFAFRHQ